MFVFIHLACCLQKQTTLHYHFPNSGTIFLSKVTLKFFFLLLVVHLDYLFSLVLACGLLSFKCSHLWDSIIIFLNPVCICAFLHSIHILAHAMGEEVQTVSKQKSRLFDLFPFFSLWKD